MTASLTTAPPEAGPPRRGPGALGWVELARWAWRQLTSMRVALILLFLLAVAAIPGSVIPQTEINPLDVADFRARNPGLSEWLDRLGMFDVFSAPWFAAIYLALLVSLVGCILPRLWQHWKAMRATPPRAPRRLSRMPSYREVEVEASAADVLVAARDELKARRYRLAPAQDDQSSVAGEVGYLRETGNLLFHLSLVGVLLAVALGSLFGYRATVIVPEGSGFSNSVIQFDNLSAGAWFDSSDLPPFTIDVDKFKMTFVDSGSKLGQADEFEATVTFTPKPGADPEIRTIRVNEPLSVDGTLVHILNPGYAPAITIRSPDREVLYTGPTPFLPQDNNFTSTGVVKASVPTSVGEDIGVEGVFLPTAVVDDAGPRSVFPEARNPALFLTAYHGDLGLDDGEPQSVYKLDRDQMTQYRSEDGSPFRAALSVGETIELPDGNFITFDGYTTWVNLQISRNFGKEIALVAAVTAVLGLMGSLYVRRRRAWVRIASTTQRSTVFEIAGLQRSESGTMDAEIDDITRAIQTRLSANTEREADS